MKRLGLLSWKSMSCKKEIMNNILTKDFDAQRQLWTRHLCLRACMHLFEVMALLLLAGPFSLALAQDNKQAANAEVISRENSVDSAHLNAGWHPTFVGEKLVWHDRLRTLEDSRAALRLS